MKVRLQKVLAAAGVASRRGAEELIIRGEVSVNGKPATLGQSADPAIDEIAVRGRMLPRVTGAHRYMALNKPVGVVTTRRGTHGEQTVMGLVPDDPRLSPVGRLDKDTSGLLLLTTDGDWANRVTHPRYGVEKVYRAVVAGVPDEPSLQQLRDGITLPDGTRTAPAKVERIRDDRENATLSITVGEGKKRQIRLMFAAIGHPVRSLCRVQVGTIDLADLPEGKWRELRREEIESVRTATGRSGQAGPPAPSRGGRRWPGRVG